MSFITIPFSPFASRQTQGGQGVSAPCGSRAEPWSSRRDRRRPSLFPSLLFLVCLVLPLPANGADLSGLAPDVVGDMARISLLSGADALKAVDDLHGKRIQAEAAVVARYARPGERPAELWVSRAASATEARRQTGLMVHMMFDNPKSPFSDPGRLEHAGIPIYRFSGMGQVHLIWYRDDLAYWVSCNPDDASAFLKAVCR